MSFIEAVLVLSPLGVRSCSKWNFSADLHVYSRPHRCRSPSLWLNHKGSRAGGAGGRLTLFKKNLKVFLGVLGIVIEKQNSIIQGTLGLGYCMDFTSVASCDSEGQPVTTSEHLVPAVLLYLSL